jgi:hypothetical protein
MPKRYRFQVIFDFNSRGDFIIPKFNIIINGVPFSKGTAIYRSTFLGGLNLFNYIDRDIAGEWNSRNRTLNILGFY